MELQMSPQVTKSMGRTTPPHHHAGGAGAGARPVPGYLRPAVGSCHHVCKYGGTHEFEEKEPKKKKKLHPKPRKPLQQPPPATSAESQSKVMVKVRSVFRRRVGDSSTADKTSAGKGNGGGENVGVEWKDIIAYDNMVPQRGNKISAAPVVAGSGDARKKKKNDVTKGSSNNSHDDEGTITGHVNGVETEATQDGAMAKKANTSDDVIKSVIKPPKGKKKKKPVSLVLEELAAMDQEVLHGYEIISPSVMQSRATLLRDLQEEMTVHGAAADAKEAERAKPPPSSLNEEEYAAVVAAETTRPIPAHRRAKSMSISSRSVRFPSNPITRQASKNSAVTFKLKSRSTKAPIAPLEEEEKPAMARLRSRRGSEDASSGSIGGRGFQFRIRSLRRRGLGGGGGGSSAGGFVVPAVALRHQKTMERKKSQRLYNNMIEETASKLVKTRKSRVKALVGAFESVINKIAK